MKQKNQQLTQALPARRLVEPLRAQRRAPGVLRAVVIRPASSSCTARPRWRQCPRLALVALRDENAHEAVCETWHSPHPSGVEALLRLGRPRADACSCFLTRQHLHHVRASLASLARLMVHHLARHYRAGWS